MSPATPNHPPPPASSDSELVAFLTSATPRHAILQKLLRESRAQFAVSASLFMSATCILSGIIFLYFVLKLIPPVTVLLHDRDLSKNHATATGIVMSVARKDLTSSKSDKILYELTFEFAPSNAEGSQVTRIKGICYANEERWKKDERVTVEYDPADTTLARIQGARLSKADTGLGRVWTVPFAVVMSLVMLGVGIRHGRAFLKKRNQARWLLENGTVGEFSIVDFQIIHPEDKAPLIHVYWLKPANRADDQRSYFSQLTKENQVDYADAVRRSKTTTFGLYDPTDNNAKCHVLLVEAWFHVV